MGGNREVEVQLPVEFTKQIRGHLENFCRGMTPIFQYC
jgi:hypothetical protein